MLTDANSIPRNSVLEGDLCVIGAGPAGITVARRFLDKGKRVILLESGGTGFTKSLRHPARVLTGHLFREQSLNRGINAGLPYYPLRFTRARAFGGTTRALEPHGLMSRPLDAVDFESRPGLPRSGWPFARETLDPFYDTASEICGLEPGYDLGPFEKEVGAPRLPIDESLAETVLFRFGPEETFASYLDEFAASSNVELILHATAIELHALRANWIDKVRVATMRGNRLEVKARLFVLAMGAIENARLLLSSKKSHPLGIGNTNDLVGRFFMEHPDLNVGHIPVAPPKLMACMPLYDAQTFGSGDKTALLRLSNETIRREGLLNSVFTLRSSFPGGERPAIRSARILRRSLHHLVRSPSLDVHVRIAARNALSGMRDMLRSRFGAPRSPSILVDAEIEQTPDPRSRVRLGTRRDRFGVPVAVLEWRLTDRDIHSIRRTTQLLRDAFHKAGLGGIEITVDTETSPLATFGNWHHLGTTRMDRDPREGVVDALGRVHEVDNLYVAGGSVFPTGGAVNPTLTIVALSVRLADHLARWLDSGITRPES